MWFYNETRHLEEHAVTESVYGSGPVLDRHPRVIQSAHSQCVRRGRNGQTGSSNGCADDKQHVLLDSLPKIGEPCYGSITPIPIGANCDSIVFKLR